MNIQRARQIANSFSRIDEMQVEEVFGGLLVHHQRHSRFFMRESCFWPFVFKIAGKSSKDVAEIEMKLEA